MSASVSLIREPSTVEYEGEPPPTEEMTIIEPPDDETMAELFDLGDETILVEVPIIEEINPINFRPAATWSIRALEEFTFEGPDPVKEACTICMEEFARGAVLKRMPCLHPFHRDCIIQWLETCHKCPLCRFVMPCRRLSDEVD